MRSRSSPFGIVTILLIVMLAVNCASVFGPPQDNQTSEQKTVEDLKKSIVVIHDSLYVPTMTRLGQRLNAGQISPNQEKNIQEWSEYYQKAKTAADTLLQTWGRIRSPAEDQILLARELSEMTTAITHIESQ